MGMFLITGLVIALVALAMLIWLHAARPAVRQRQLVAREHRLAELRLQQLSFAAMLRLLDEARRSR